MRKRILIVDDNELIVEVMSYILINNGYDVFSLPNGDRVIEEVKKTHPDLLIMDANMPGMDGRDICKILKLNKSTMDTPVIICSAEEDLDAALNGEGRLRAVLCGCAGTRVCALRDGSGMASPGGRADRWCRASVRSTWADAHCFRVVYKSTKMKRKASTANHPREPWLYVRWRLRSRPFSQRHEPQASQ